MVTLTANDNAKGWGFHNWTGACTISESTCQVTITNMNQSVTAIFFNPELVDNGGPILPTTTTKVIFWGVKWGDPSFVADKITGIDSWYEGVAAVATRVRWMNTPTPWDNTSPQPQLTRGTSSIPRLPTIRVR